LETDVRPVRWVGSSRRDLRSFPQAVRREIGQALYAAQRDKVFKSSKPLTGFGGASVLEIVAPFDTDTYRAVYTVQFRSAIYVLHAFKKKSTKGKKTPKKETDVLTRRLEVARQHHNRKQH